MLLQFSKLSSKVLVNLEEKVLKNERRIEMGKYILYLVGATVSSVAMIGAIFFGPAAFMKGNYFLFALAVICSCCGAVVYLKCEAKI